MPETPQKPDEKVEKPSPAQEKRDAEKAKKDEKEVKERVEREAEQAKQDDADVEVFLAFHRGERLARDERGALDLFAFEAAYRERKEEEQAEKDAEDED